MTIRPVCQRGRFKSYIPEAKEIPYFLLTCLMTDVLNLIDVVSVALEGNNQAANNLREQRLKTFSERLLDYVEDVLLGILWE